MNKSLLLSHRATPGLAFLRPLFRSVCIIGPIFCFAQLLLGVDDEIATTINTDVSTFVATGNGYDAYAGAVSRTATDLVVPGATSSHGLVLQRTYSSTLSGGWNFSPLWGIDTYTTPPGAGTLVVHFPDGRSMGFNAPTQAGETAKRAAPGTKERLFVTQTTADLYLEDGSRVHFSKTTDTSGNDAYLITWFTLQYLVDPYGQTTTFAWEYYDFYGTPPHIRLKQVTDPSGRTLTYTYDPVKKLYPTQVTASTG